MFKKVLQIIGFGGIIYIHYYIKEKENKKMGLITCPKCGKQISDKAVSCPQCNFDFSNQGLFVCTECGCTYANAEACPQCGCPKPVATAKAPKKKRKGIIIAVVAIALVIALASFGIKTVKEAIYYSQMEEVTYAMLNSGADAETAGNLIVSVWNNAIYEKRSKETDKFTLAYNYGGTSYRFVDDFNTALSNLFADADFSADIQQIEKERAEITSCMKELKDPPKKYKDAYQALKTYYDDYMKFTSVVIECNGSLNSFSEEFGECDDKFVDSYDKMCFYLD